MKLSLLGLILAIATTALAGPLAQYSPESHGLEPEVNPLCTKESGKVSQLTVWTIANA